MSALLEPRGLRNSCAHCLPLFQELQERVQGHPKKASEVHWSVMNTGGASGKGLTVRG